MLQCETGRQMPKEFESDHNACRREQLIQGD